MVYTVKQLADLAGVSVRTLHYYDEIGLLPPERGSGNGYRYYGEADILRLQQILFYKELGLGLDEIGALLQQPGFDVVRALEEHRGALAQRLGRLRRLMLTVDRTIAHLKGETPMDAKGLFEGFSEAEEAQYTAEAEALWGESVRELSRKWKAYTPAEEDTDHGRGQSGVRGPDRPAGPAAGQRRGAGGDRALAPAPALLLRAGGGSAARAGEWLQRRSPTSGPPSTRWSRGWRRSCVRRSRCTAISWIRRGKTTGRRERNAAGRRARSMPCEPPGF